MDNPPKDLREVPHHDSGYFPGMSNRVAWVVLGSITTVIAALCIGVWFMLG